MMKWSEIKLRELVGTEINVSGEEIQVTDYCRGCRIIWGENKLYKFYLKVNKSGLVYINHKQAK